MKITKRTLKRIIQEEIKNVLLEMRLHEAPPVTGGTETGPVTELPPLTVVANEKNYDPKAWDMERRRINALRKQGVIDKDTWRRGRRALSNTSIAAARKAIGGASFPEVLEFPEQEIEGRLSTYEPQTATEIHGMEIGEPEYNPGTDQYEFPPTHVRPTKHGA